MAWSLVQALTLRVVRPLLGATAVILGIGVLYADLALGAASARAFRRLAVSAVAFSSDGSRYVAWQVSKGSPVVVFDTRTRHRGQLALDGCELLDQGGEPEAGWRAADGRFLVSCAHLSGLLNVRTGTVTALPERPGGAPYWVVVGSRYVEGPDDNNNRCRRTAREVRQERSCIALYDISTGAVSDRPPSQIADLDRPGAPPVCGRLRGKVIEDRAAHSDGVFAEGTEPLRIYRCTGRTTFLGAPGEIRDVELRAGLLTWDTGQHAPEYGGPFPSGHGVLESYRLSTGRRRSFTLPRLPLPTGEQEYPVVVGVFGYSTHTANTVFWIATHTLLFGQAGSVVGTSAVYAAKL
jgi:hypothetical protein